MKPTTKPQVNQVTPSTSNSNESPKRTGLYSFEELQSSDSAPEIRDSQNDPVSTEGVTHKPPHKAKEGTGKCAAIWAAPAATEWDLHLVPPWHLQFAKYTVPYRDPDANDVLWNNWRARSLMGGKDTMLPGEEAFMLPEESTRHKG